MTPAAAARRFLRARRSGVLATLCQRHEGHPYASTVNFVPDADGCPVLLLSALAEHTRNLRADPRVSLLVADPAEDMQAAPRLTLLGNAEPRPEAFRERYLRLLPQAASYAGLPDFACYGIRPLRLRFIGGFGDIRWIEAAAYAMAPGELAVRETEILARWNGERSELLRTLCRRRLADDTAAEAVGLDCDGLDLRAGSANLRFDFDAAAATEQEALAALYRITTA